MKLVLTFISVFILVSCSTGGHKSVNYQSSSTAPSLIIPPDLTGLDDSNNVGIPNSPLGTLEVIGHSGEKMKLDRVLPKIEGITLMGQGDYHWLEVKQDKVELYEMVKDFWSEEGFLLVRDEPAIGIMQTEWLENKAGSLEPGSLLSGLIGMFSSTDTKDQYRVRIEDGGDVSKLYLTQKGQKYVTVEDTKYGNSHGWEPRATEPELEVEMLSRIMLFLGMQNEDVKQQLAKIGQFSPRAKITKTDKDAKTDRDVTILTVIESFDRTWNRTLLNLDRLDVEYISKDKVKGVIWIKQKAKEPKKKNFLQNLFSKEAAEEEMLELKIMLNENASEATEITIDNRFGVKDKSEQALAVLYYLYERLK